MRVEAVGGGAQGSRNKYQMDATLAVKLGSESEDQR
jgi:hypothetical protein